MSDASLKAAPEEQAGGDGHFTDPCGAERPRSSAKGAEMATEQLRLETTCRGFGEAESYPEQAVLG